MHFSPVFQLELNERVGEVRKSIAALVALDDCDGRARLDLYTHAAREICGGFMRVSEGDVDRACIDARTHHKRSAGERKR